MLSEAALWVRLLLHKVDKSQLRQSEDVEITPLDFQISNRDILKELHGPQIDVLEFIEGVLRSHNRIRNNSPLQDTLNIRNSIKVHWTCCQGTGPLSTGEAHLTSILIANVQWRC